jgi:ABC-type nitrate/sulfonate/bicarbonate transport system substrate-binding protein
MRWWMRRMPHALPLLVGTALLGAACAAGGAPRAPERAAPPPPAAAAPHEAGPGPAAPAPAAERPERETLRVAAAATSTGYLPLQMAVEAGYFQQHGLTVELSVVSASVAAQGLVSGSIDIYQGGATAIAARLAGSDIIYVAALVDRSTLVLFGDRGITAFPDFRGRAIATTSAGAFGEIAVNQTAREYGLVPGQDFAFRYHASPEAAFVTFVTGGTDGLVIGGPQRIKAQELGYPVVVDYFERGLRIVGPGTSLTRDFARAAPNTVKAYLRGLLDGVKRCLDDPAYALAVNAKYAQTDDLALVARDYEEASRTWNKDMTVDRSAIEVVLASSAHPNARTANPDDFYDNSFIQEVNATYAVRLFPEAFARR